MGEEALAKLERKCSAHTADQTELKIVCNSHDSANHRKGAKNEERIILRLFFRDLKL
jgi:hypothetical protein